MSLATIGVGHQQCSGHRTGIILADRARRVARDRGAIIGSRDHNDRRTDAGIVSQAVVVFGLDAVEQPQLFPCPEIVKGFSTRIEVPVEIVIGARVGGQY